MLGGLPPRGDRYVVADLPAGLVSAVIANAGAPPDVLVVMAEPYPRSAEVARRLCAQADAAGIPRVVVVGNRVDNAGDRAMLGELVGTDPDVVLPSDPALGDADRLGLAPLDHAPTSPVVAGVAELTTHFAALINQSIGINTT